MIQSIYRALSTVDELRPAPADVYSPAVPVRKSVFPDFIVCLEDGQKLKMLKGHLQASYGLTPDAYRARWRSPPDYPMVAPNYAANKRSDLAKSIGLGRKPSAEAGEPEATQSYKPEVTIVPARCARGSKARCDRKFLEQPWVRAAADAGHTDAQQAKQGGFGNGGGDFKFGCQVGSKSVIGNNGYCRIAKVKLRECSLKSNSGCGCGGYGAITMPDKMAGGFGSAGRALHARCTAP